MSRARSDAPAAQSKKQRQKGRYFSDEEMLHEAAWEKRGEETKNNQFARLNSAK